MSHVYFEGWYHGCYIKAEDWYTDNLVYVNIRRYVNSTAISRPDEEKSFLVKFDVPNRISHYPASIAAFLMNRNEIRDASGKLIPITCKLPEVDLASTAMEPF